MGIKPNIRIHGREEFYVVNCSGNDGVSKRGLHRKHGVSFDRSLRLNTVLGDWRCSLLLDAVTLV